MSWNQGKLFEHVNIYRKYEASGLLFELHAAGFLGSLGGGFWVEEGGEEGKGGEGQEDGGYSHLEKEIIIVSLYLKRQMIRRLSLRIHMASNTQL